ncbi:uncharacterized protein LOC114528708 [Dendronephthya gigantea]|uniref:uncharacterized protein LOC114528708 n=1 Tax=Dendronephthya gigantea TaxID=151771 RepID=UPI00106A7EE8|nr:uncharacterized protein LOC114528708 [Dendronephthya gigantea]
MSGSKRWKRTSSIVMSGPSIAWSNVDFTLKEFVQKNTLPQAVRVKKDASKSIAFKSSVDLILHESKTIKKVEACVVSEGKTFVLPYDCPAKVFQLTKADEYESLGELRKVLPTCRFIFVTSEPKDQQLADIERGEVLTIVFKRNISGSDVFTCTRKKSGEKIEIKASAKGGFAAMGTTAERKINDFVRQYSTFPVAIGLTESTLTNKAFSALNDVISQSKSGLIHLKRCFAVDTVIGSSLGKKKTVYAIPKALEITVTASKALLQSDSEHTDFCRKLHEDVDQASVTTRLNLAVSFSKVENEVLQWVYGDDSAYDEVVPLATGKGKNSKVNGELPKRDGGVREQVRQISGSDLNSKESKEKIKEKESKEKIKEKEPKEKEKPKDKEPKEKATKEKKDKKTKEAKQEKPKVEKSKSNEKQKDEGRKVSSSKEEPVEDPVEDDAGYLVPAELLRAQRQASEEENKAGQSKERSSIGVQLGRFMDKVKGKKDGKKTDRPVSNIEIVHETHGEPIKKSATMPANSNIKKPDLKKKATTMSADQLNKDDTDDTTDGPAASSKEKEGKKRDKGVFGTAGRKAGAKLRHKLARNKAGDEDDNSKSTSPTSSLPTPPKDEEIDEQDMYVTPVDNQLSNSASTSIADRQLPSIPPEELRKPSTISVPDIPYDDEDLYDEIEPKKSFKIPKDLSKLSTSDMSEVLRALNMAEHVPKFRNEQIDGEIFKSLDEKTLGALGVIDPVQRLKVKKLLKGWRPK